jgi:hypothetical protein
MSRAAGISYSSPIDTFNVVVFLFLEYSSIEPVGSAPAERM